MSTTRDPLVMSDPSPGYAYLKSSSQENDQCSLTRDDQQAPWQVQVLYAVAPARGLRLPHRLLRVPKELDAPPEQPVPPEPALSGYQCHDVSPRPDRLHNGHRQPRRLRVILRYSLKHHQVVAHHGWR